MDEIRPAIVQPVVVIVPDREVGNRLDQLGIACDAASAGSRVRLEMGDKALEGRVESTGGWEQFKLLDLGTLERSAPGAGATGPSVVLRPLSKPASAVVNLRAVYWVKEPAEAR